MTKITDLRDTDFDDFMASDVMKDAEIEICLYNSRKIGGIQGKVRAILKNHHLINSYGDFYVPDGFGDTKDLAIDDLKYVLSGQYYIVSDDIEKTEKERAKKKDFTYKRFPFFK